MVASVYLAGRYRLIERLGAGGMSVVWRAYDEVLRRRVAVKLLAPRFAADPDSRERIRAEARAAARLSHQYITAVHDYGESTSADGATVPFVVMELVDGEPLDARLAHGPLGWRVAAEIGSQVAAALAAVHAHGLVHRDVKPANVVLTASGPKLVDFGISAVAGDRSDCGGQVMGTPAYLAPERLDGGPAHAASDVYALGLVLYKMLAGRLPWDADTTTRMLTAHCYLEPAPLPRISGLPETVADLCRRCLAKEPDRRPRAAEVARALAGLAAADAAADATAVEPAVGVAATVVAVERPARRRLVGVGALVAGLATAGLALATCQGPDPQDRPAQAAGAGPAAAGRDCEVRYATRSDAGGRFLVEMSVVNRGASPVPDWRLDFEYPGDQRVLGLDGARFTQDGARVTVLGGGVLPAGATATVNLTGAYGTGNPMPVDFALAGRQCLGRVVGAAGEPAAGGAGGEAAGGPGGQAAVDPGGRAAGGAAATGGAGNSGPGSDGRGSGKEKKGKKKSGGD